LPDKPLYLIRHARNKCRLWRITQDEIAEAIDNPGATEPSILNRVNYWHRRRDTWIRLTTVEEGDRIVVISVTPRRKGPGGQS
jgi:hypothetical protein